MEDTELKALWQAYDQKLERSLALNLHLVKELQTQKDLLYKQLGGSREYELQKQMEQLKQQLGSANAQP